MQLFIYRRSRIFIIMISLVVLITCMYTVFPVVIVSYGFLFLSSSPCSLLLFYMYNFFSFVVIVRKDVFLSLSYS